MNQLASPGPDGFGPFFYRKFWPILKPKITNLFHSFYNLSADLSCLNRSLIVLIPKSTAAPSPDSFRPISIQNCPAKAIAKLLANRLKAEILNLVHHDQTGFLSGRTITENFIYAADILHVCAETKAPMFVVKLYFSKAFDSVCWTSLLAIMRSRNFSNKWLN